MCGLAGGLGVADALKISELMAARLVHRGPDAHGSTILTARGASTPLGAFSHRRLSILDLTDAGIQPMMTRDGRYTIIFNGEIYNFRVLRQALERAGDQFRSNSDTEVLLLGWARHGVGMLPKLRGMFAFAIWDADEGRLTLARDRYGIKPLYYAATSKGLLFASELRALLASGLIAPRLAPAALSSYLQYGSVADPLTMIDGIAQLSAGSSVTVEMRAGALTVSPARPFAGPLDQSDFDPPGDSLPQTQVILEALQDSLSQHLVSDVPVGFFLSGGIDSSVLVALARQQLGVRPRTFTVRFDERSYDEGAIARSVAARFDCEHHEISLSETDIMNMIADGFGAMDQPTADGFNTYVVSRAVHEQGIKVVLSGIGADEIFGGYPSFHRAQLAEKLFTMPSLLRAGLRNVIERRPSIRAAKLAAFIGSRTPALAAYRASRLIFGSSQISALLSAPAGTGDERMAEPATSSGTYEQIAWHELTGYLRNTLLRDSDSFSMASSIELRTPYVDAGVVRAALLTHQDVRFTRQQPKPLLVNTFRGLLPPEVWNRPKQGFTLPFELWMRGPLRPAIADVLSADHVARIGLAEPAVRAVWNEFLGRRRGVNWTRPWCLYALARWATENSVSI